MSNEINNKRKISTNIQKNLEKYRLDGFIDSFHIENQFGLNIITIYILGKLEKLDFFHHFFKNDIYNFTSNFSVDVSILYNAIVNENMMDVEFLQSREEIMRGYSVKKFGYSIEMSDDMAKEFYAEMTRNSNSKI